MLDRFGVPEEVFGPNLRFRVVAAFCGVVLVLMGVLFFLAGLGGGDGRLPLGGWVGAKLAAPLLVLGAVVMIGARLVPRNWVFVCPRGVVRTRGAIWEGVGWAEVERFEDATLTGQMVALRQCRLVLKGGGEWGFLADYVAEYGRLAEALRRKVGEWQRDSAAAVPPVGRGGQ